MDLGEPEGSEPGIRRPFVVVQNNLINRSRIRTVVVCALTSNRRLGAVPGNVTLAVGEANLPARSVVNVSQLFTVDKSQLEDRLGVLTARRVRQILDGIALILEPRQNE